MITLAVTEMNAGPPSLFIPKQNSSGRVRNRSECAFLGPFLQDVGQQLALLSNSKIRAVGGGVSFKAGICTIPSRICTRFSAACPQAYVVAVTQYEVGGLVSVFLSL